MNILWCYNFCS